MRKLNDLKKCEFALNMTNAVLDMVEKENKKNTSANEKIKTEAENV